MKTWVTPEVEELEINKTAHGSWDGADWDGVYEGGLPFNPDDVENALS